MVKIDKLKDGSIKTEVCPTQDMLSPELKEHFTGCYNTVINHAPRSRYCKKEKEKEVQKEKSFLSRLMTRIRTNTPLQPSPRGRMNVWCLSPPGVSPARSFN